MGYWIYFDKFSIIFKQNIKIKLRDVLENVLGILSSANLGQLTSQVGKNLTAILTQIAGLVGQQSNATE